jgi:hypothetical protein
MYDSSWRGGVSNNYGNIYILDSKPIDYKGEKSAWSFGGHGDSGGPILSYNPRTYKFQIEGVISAGLFCNYSGFFAQLPYPYSIASSTTYPQNYNFIKSVMSGTPDPSQVRCNGECYFKTLYVINQTSNNINRYKFDHNNSLLLASKSTTGNYPTQIAFNPVNNTALVTNFVSNSISEYKTSLDGGLQMHNTIHLEPGHNNPIDTAFLSNNYMVVLARNSHSILKYGIELDGNWSFKEAYPTLENPTHLNVIQINSRKYLLVTNDHEIAVYQWDNNKSILININRTLELTSDMGKLIEIKPLEKSFYTMIYVLTTKGVYIYRLTRSDNAVTFRLLEKLLNHFSPDSHLIQLYDYSFAISDRYSDNVILYEVDISNIIKLKNYITIPEPGEMTFDDGTLYISSFPRSLYSYKISYPNLTVSAEPNIIQTGEGPTIVKINKQKF